MPNLEEYHAILAENVALQNENKRLEHLWSDDELFEQVTELRDAADAHREEKADLRAALRDATDAHREEKAALENQVASALDIPCAVSRLDCATADNA